MTFILCSGLLRSGPVSTDGFDSQVRKLLQLEHVPGAAIAIVCKGELLDEITFGSASLQLGVPVRPDTEFQLASVTKVFTALALLRLEQDGVLRLEDPVSKYLPGLPLPSGDITLRELATHTSGLPDVIDTPNKPLSESELNRSGDEALRLAEKKPIQAPPGTRFAYDQTNYLLLMRVIEHASGMEFRKFVTTHVLGTDMPHTVWGDARSIVDRRTEMYTALYDNRIENGTNLFLYPKYLDAAAGLNSTIRDMEQFAVLLTTDHLLSGLERERLWQPAKNRDGKVIDIAIDMQLGGVVAPAIGWFYADNSKGRYPRLFMSGGSAVSIVVFPKQELCIVTLTNLQAKDDPLPIAEMIAKFYLPDIQPIF